MDDERTDGIGMTIEHCVRQRPGMGFVAIETVDRETIPSRGFWDVGVGLYLSDNILVETDQDIFLGRRDIFGLDIGARSKATVSVSIPQYTPSGAYYIGGIVDPDYFIDEEDESNNTRIAAAKIQIGEPAPADLIERAIEQAGRKPGVEVYAISDELKQWLQTALGC